MPKPKQVTSPQDVVGRTVKVMPPFDRTFPDTYTVTDYMSEDGTLQYTLDGLPGWFAAHFLELV